MENLRNLAIALLFFEVIAAIFWGSRQEKRADALTQRISGLTKTNNELRQTLEEWQGRTCALELGRLKKLPPPPYSGLASDDAQLVKEPLKVSLPTPGQQSGPGANPE